ncbi:DUF4286 family protein [Luteimonas sp. 50]|uniref:DUF4286 family protein n=1 Tax=Cognatiluteimonas sedimenti TaxID=2927791 RepID=A0ABT0A656_9GAMM|nr:DUF4286 family protein [Lysobacter sedimenti]MCJ0826466.1 DUF4286 family protein [Lysobacter sedimenti]
MSVVYEVTLEIEAAIAADYRAWLHAHVDRILALPGFTAARIFEVLEPAPPSGTAALCVQYALRDRAALDAYLRDHAARMRAEGIARFGNRFRASRRILAQLSRASDAPSGT